MLRNQKSSILVFMVLAPMIWAVSTVAMKWSSSYIPMTLFNALRFLTITPLIFFFKKPDQPIIRLFLVALTWFAMNFYFLGKAIGSGLDVGYLSLGYITTSVFVFILSYIINGDKLNTNQLWGTLLAFSGLIFIALDKAGNWTHTSGLIYLILSTLFVAWGMVLLKKFNMNSDLSTIVWLSSLSSLCLSGLSGWDLGWPQVSTELNHITPDIIGAILFSSYGATVIGGIMWIKVVKTVGPNMSSLALFLIPILNLFLGACLFDEEITLFKVASAILILTGVFIAVRLYQDTGIRKLS